MLNLRVGDGYAQALGDLRRCFEAGLRQQNPELLAADACKQVLRS
jgi:hypothetical protein